MKTEEQTCSAWDIVLQRSWEDRQCWPTCRPVASSPPSTPDIESVQIPIVRNIHSSSSILTDLFKIEHIGVVSSLARHLQLHDVVSDRNRCQDGGHPDLVPDCSVKGSGREGSCRSETSLLSPKIFDNLLVNTYQENSDSLQERWWRWLVSEGSRKEGWSDTGQLW